MTLASGEIQLCVKRSPPRTCFALYDDGNQQQPDGDSRKLSVTFLDNAIVIQLVLSAFLATCDVTSIDLVCNALVLFVLVYT
ncbi:MAG: hypothetical protein AAGD07_12520 [Planctomycetota bacterium]